MEKPVQTLAGALQRTGPQPVNSMAAVAASIGTVEDGLASPVGGGTLLACMSRVIVQNEAIIELLARLVELHEERH